MKKIISIGLVVLVTSMPIMSCQEGMSTCTVFKAIKTLVFATGSVITGMAALRQVGGMLPKASKTLNAKEEQQAPFWNTIHDRLFVSQDITDPKHVAFTTINIAASVLLAQQAWANGKDIWNELMNDDADQDEYATTLD